MTFYVDASVPLAVRMALASLRDDVCYAGQRGCPKESAQDKDWLPIAGENEWVVLKRDKKIRSRQWEREALIEARVRSFCLTGGGNYTRWETMRLLAVRWDRIEEVAATIPGPYIYSVTWQGVRVLALPGVTQPQN